MSFLKSSRPQTHSSSSFHLKRASNWKRRASNSPTKIRLRILTSQAYPTEPVFSRLILNYGLIVNIIGANLTKNTSQGWFDLELRGSIPELQKALAYLQHLEFKILGKANPDGDAW